MKLKIIFAIIFIFFVYILSYAFIRQVYSEVWERDGKTYIILPENRIFYYLYRPLSIMDKGVTGINTHIGEHK
jgi:hypothetical protein